MNPAFYNIEGGDLDMNEGGYALSPQSARLVHETYEQQIAQEISNLEKQLEKKKRLQQLLKENPVILEFMNLSRS